jgi:hypothetical protein
LAFMAVMMSAPSFSLILMVMASSSLGAR